MSHNVVMCFSEIVLYVTNDFHDSHLYINRSLQISKLMILSYKAYMQFVSFLETVWPTSVILFVNIF